MKRGKEFEDRAARFLRKAGLDIIARNYRCKAGEIDLICRDGTTLVFVEVRFRRPHGFASAAESITPAKQRRLIAASQHYLQSKQLLERTPCRIDALLFDGTFAARGNASRHPGEDEIQWVKNAIGR